MNNKKIKGLLNLNPYKQPEDCKGTMCNTCENPCKHSLWIRAVHVKLKIQLQAELYRSCLQKAEEEYASESPLFGNREYWIVCSRIYRDQIIKLCSTLNWIPSFSKSSKEWPVVKTSEGIDIDYRYK